MYDDKGLHGRHSLRLAGYDYRQCGAYFVTVCVHDREELLGTIESGEMSLSAAGRAVTEAWHSIPQRFAVVHLDSYVAMPNHVHGLLWLDASAEPQDGGASRNSRATGPSLGEIMRAFKSLSAIAANRVLGRGGVPFWQRNYYEHIVRNDDELDQIRRYIVSNPAQWADDPDNVHRT